MSVERPRSPAKLQKKRPSSGKFEKSRDVVSQHLKDRSFLPFLSNFDGLPRNFRPTSWYSTATFNSSSTLRPKSCPTQSSSCSTLTYTSSAPTWTTSSSSSSRSPSDGLSLGRNLKGNLLYSVRRWNRLMGDRWDDFDYVLKKGFAKARSRCLRRSSDGDDELWGCPGLPSPTGVKVADDGLLCCIAEERLSRSWPDGVDPLSSDTTNAIATATSSSYSYSHSSSSSTTDLDPENDETEGRIPEDTTCRLCDIFYPGTEGCKCHGEAEQLRSAERGEHGDLRHGHAFWMDSEVDLIGEAGERSRINVHRQL